MSQGAAKTRAARKRSVVVLSAVLTGLLILVLLISHHTTRTDAYVCLNCGLKKTVVRDSYAIIYTRKRPTWVIDIEYIVFPKGGVTFHEAATGHKCDHDYRHVGVTTDARHVLFHRNVESNEVLAQDTEKHLDRLSRWKANRLHSYRSTGSIPPSEEEKREYHAIVKDLHELLATQPPEHR